MQPSTCKPSRDGADDPEADCRIIAPMRLSVLGSDRLLESDDLDGRRVGIVCNPASVDGELRHIVDRLARHPRARLAAIFGPQHGFRSDVQENMIETGHARDDDRRVPIYSLYSETREPTAEMLRDLDVLVIDLQDVGTRIYTYIYTMANCLIAARAARRQGRSSAIGRIRSAASASKDRCSSPGSSRSSACIRFRCGTG